MNESDDLSNTTSFYHVITWVVYPLGQDNNMGWHQIIPFSIEVSRIIELFMEAGAMGVS